MDILIRNVNAGAVLKLKEQARQNRISREKYLREHLAEIAYNDERNEIEDNYRRLSEEMTAVLKQTEKTIDDLSKKIDRLVDKITL